MFKLTDHNLAAVSVWRYFFFLVQDCYIILAKSYVVIGHTIKFRALWIKPWKNVKLTNVRCVCMPRPGLLQFIMPDKRKNKKSNEVPQEKKNALVQVL